MLVNTFHRIFLQIVSTVFPCLTWVLSTERCVEHIIGKGTHHFKLNISRFSYLGHLFFPYVGVLPTLQCEAYIQVLCPWQNTVKLKRVFSLAPNGTAVWFLTIFYEYITLDAHLLILDSPKGTCHDLAWAMTDSSHGCGPAEEQNSCLLF